MTNDYQQFSVSADQPSNEILATSCNRLKRIVDLLSVETPDTPEACFKYLDDPAVRMQITVQQMVFEPATGKYWVRIPG